ncbi:MAG: glycosyltransferase family 2 protein [Dokdonella sp.]
MSTTTFAVVVTCYNYKDFVEEAIDSALAQTRVAAQIIVVDDGSTDGSTQLLRERYGSDPRITLVCVANGGQLSAFQQGLAHVDADVVCFLDADDRWSPEYLEKIGALFDERSDVDFVFTNICLFGNDTRRLGFADRATDFGYTVVSTYILGQKYGAPTSALALRSAWARRTLDLPRDQLPAWRICADNCLVYGASVLGARKYYLPTDCVHYRTHGNNGWWGGRRIENEFLDRFRTRCLIEQYARSIGLGELSVDMAKYEFRTKPVPTWRETKRYAELAMRSRAPWTTRIERALRILKLGRRHRQQAAVEYKAPP